MPGKPGEDPDLPADPLDRALLGTLRDLAADMPGFLRKLLGDFRDGCARRLSDMHEAGRSGDLEALRFAAHSMRGNCGVIGAQRMAGLAARLEDSPPDSDRQRQALVRQLDAEYARVRQELDEMAAELTLT